MSLQCKDNIKSQNHKIEFQLGKTKVRNILNVVLSLLLGCGILWWMYRGFDFSQIKEVVSNEMDWSFMLLSMVFGVTAQLFRGLRWQQSLEPLGEHSRKSTCIHAVFISYASSLLIPRVGEVARCGVLSRYDKVSFAKSIGTVVTERIIDTLLIMFIVAVVIISQFGKFMGFFAKTGTNLNKFFSQFTTTGYIVTGICLTITIFFLYWLWKKMTSYVHFRTIINDILSGIKSIKSVRRKWLFVTYTLGIWVSYFLHFYITFFCFSFSENLGLAVALVAFVVGSIAVIVPTPNGLGPWHFAVKTILVLYGVSAVNGETFVLIVHTLQTALIPLLGVFSLICLSFTSPKE